MPTSKSPKSSKKKEATTEATTEATAIVSSLGVNDTPKPTKAIEKTTAHGNTITMN